MRERASGRDVEAVDARLLEPLADLDGLLERVPVAHPRIDVAQVLARADLELHVVVVAHLAPDRSNDLEREARPVLERAAVLVLPVVDRRREELRDQVAVAAVDLDPVRAGLARAARALRERVDDLVDLRVRHPLALEPVQRLPLVGRREALLVLDPRNVALTARERDLDDVAAVVLVDAADELAVERDQLVAVDVRVVRHDQPARVDGRVRRDDRPDPALRELDVPVDPDLGPGTVVVVEPPGEARAEEPVLDRQVPELERLEDDVVVDHATSTGVSWARNDGSP